MTLAQALSTRAISTTLAIFTIVSIGSGVFAVGCRSRNFNTGSSGVKSKSPPVAASGPLFLEPIVDKTLLDDLPEYQPTNEPPSNFGEDAQVVWGWKSFSSLLDAKGKLPKPTSASNPGVLNPFEYGKIKKKAGNASPIPLASASVLQILRKNRTEFAKIGAGRVEQTPPILGFGPRINSLVASKYAVILDAALPFSATACATYDEPDYSDIKWHYYCNIPPLFRGCHRWLVGKKFSSDLGRDFPTIAEGKMAAYLTEAGRRDYETVRDYCLDPGSLPPSPLKDEFDKKVAAEAIPFGLDSATMHEAFVKFYKSQEVKDAQGNTVNMFDYIMKSQLFAFDVERQNAVLNAYYGEMKPADKGKAFDPQSDSDCDTYRERRLKLEKLGASHCDAKSDKKYFMYSGGR